MKRSENSNMIYKHTIMQVIEIISFHNIFEKEIVTFILNFNTVNTICRRSREMFQSDISLAKNPCCSGVRGRCHDKWCLYFKLTIQGVDTMRLGQVTG